MNKAEQVLKRLEWSARYSYCTGWPCCPICKGIKPGHGKDENGVPPDNSGHRDNCELVAALTPNDEAHRKDAAGGLSGGAGCSASDATGERRLK